MTSAAADVAWDEAQRRGLDAFRTVQRAGLAEGIGATVVETSAVEAAIAVALTTYADHARAPRRPPVHALRIHLPGPRSRYARAACVCGWLGELHRNQVAPAAMRRDWDAHLDAV